MATQSGEFIYYDGRPDMENGGPDLLGRHPLRRAYRCADGWLFVSVRSRDGCCSIFGIEIAIEDASQEAVDGPMAERLAAQFATRSRDEALAGLAAAGIPAAPALNLAELFRDPQVIANGLTHEATVEPWGTFRQTGILVRYGETPISIQRAAPQLGEHTIEILREVLGYSHDRIEALRGARSVVATAEAV
jgi:crotonobetainyl-CoA:carnitine CoA-transferase CaiB-like acyl-CoA transferase